MSVFKNLCLVSLATLAAPAFAALTYVGSGNYNLGSSSGPGATSSSASDCGTLQPGGGRDALEFTGSGVNNIGLHAYACNNAGLTDFGSRASGENTYFVQGIGGVMGTFSTSDGDGFSFTINAGEVGAFGSAAFGAGEFQKSSLTIQLVIDGTTYMDLAWSAEVSANGAIAKSYTTGASTLLVGTTETSGSGYFSYGLAGDSYFIDLADGEHEISYLMTSEASGNILTTGVCTAVLYGEKRGEGGEVAAFNEGPQGPVAGEAFTSYCGAGARTGDPFGGPFDNDPIARAQAVNDLPEPMTAGLTLTALLAAVGVRRRNKR